MQLGTRYSYLRVDLDLAEDSPRHQLGVGSAHDLRWNLRFNLPRRRGVILARW